ncbi:MAG: methyl-accepting chemotaxis protein [Nitrincola lacisaponensis]|uniref:methyl-accepting chemotaxis protein n=1 Tax=Nitrincola lacisaponensis TaxID=267850 RepID=UPI00391C7742
MKRLSLRFKLILGAVLGLTLTLTAVILVGWMTMQKSGQEAVELAATSFEAQMVANLHDSAASVSTEVSVFINRSFDIPKTLGYKVSATASGSGSNAPPFQRSTVMQMVRDTLAANPAISAAYAHFEPDGYDWQDAFNIGPHLEHSSDEGVLELYWVRDSGELTFYPTADSSFKYDETLNANGIRESEWYLCPRDTLKPCLMEPYLYEISEGYEELLTSLVYPVVVDQEFRGVVGVDINLPVIQQRVEAYQQSLFNGQAEIHLISQAGFVIASSAFPDALGQRLNQVSPELQSTLASMQGDLLQNDVTTLVRTAVPFEAFDQRWLVVISLPTEVAFAATRELESNLLSGFQRTAMTMVTLGGGLLLLAVLALALWLRFTTQPMVTMRALVEDLSGAEGDLTRQLQVTSHAELIGIANGFNAFTAKLRQMIMDLNASAQALRQQSQSLVQASQQTAAATRSQQEEMQSVASAMTEMSATANEVADLAARTAQQAEDSNDALSDAREAFRHTVDEVRSVADEINQASTRVASVAESSQNIYGIIEVIQGIAEQTNLLALNAAIEAARAGDQGRGFAVVADEVRGLAKRTQDSTGQIHALIETLQKDVTASVRDMEASTQRVTKTVEDARQAYEQMESAAKSIAAITNNVTQVATAAEEQDKVSEEINRNITVVEDASARLASLAGDVREVSDTMSQITDALEQQLGKFKV